MDFKDDCAHSECRSDGHRYRGCFKKKAERNWQNIAGIIVGKHTDRALEKTIDKFKRYSPDARLRPDSGEITYRPVKKKLGKFNSIVAQSSGV